MMPRFSSPSTDGAGLTVSGLRPPPASSAPDPAPSGAVLKLLDHCVLSVNGNSSFPPLFLESFPVSPQQCLKMRVWGETSHETFEHLQHRLISFANSPIGSNDTGCDRTHSGFAYQAPFCTTQP